jgi:hypothetical protein
LKKEISLSGLPFGLIVLQDTMPTSVLFLANSNILSMANLSVKTTSGFKNNRCSPLALSAPRLQPLENPLLPEFFMNLAVGLNLAKSSNLPSFESLSMMMISKLSFTFF